MQWTKIFLTGILLGVFPVSLLALNGIFPISLNPSAHGRGGVDFAIASDPGAISTNPAGLGFQSGKNMIFSLQGFVPQIKLTNARNNSAESDFTIVPSASFFMSWDNSTQGKEIFSDPFTYMQGDAPNPSQPIAEQGQGQFSFDASQLPQEITLLTRGTEAKIFHTRIFGYVEQKSKQYTVWRSSQQFPPLVREARLSAFTVTFEWQASSNPEEPAAQAVLETEGKKKKILLQTSPQKKWNKAYIPLAWEKSDVPAYVKFSINQPKGHIKIRHFEMTVGYRREKKYSWHILHKERKLTSLGSGKEYRLLAQSTESSPRISIKDFNSLPKEESLRKIKIFYQYKLSSPTSLGDLKTELLVDKKTIATNQHPTFSHVSHADKIITYPRRESDWRFGLGVYPQSGANYTIDIKTDLFPEGLENSVTYGFITVAPTLAYRVDDRFSIGLALNLNAQVLELDGLVSQSSQILQGDIGGVTFGDALTALEGVDQVRGEVDTELLYSLGLGARVGFLWRITDRFSLGAAYSPQTWMQNLKGKATVDFTRQFDASVLSDFANLILGLGDNFSGDYDIEIKYNLPQRAGIGISYLLADNILMGLDFQWIDYSATFRELNQELTGGDNADLNTLAGSEDVQTVLPINWKDQFVLSFGLVWQPRYDLILRFGYNYGNNIVEEEFLNPLFPATLEHHFTVGCSYQINSNLTFHAAFEVDFADTLKSGDVNRVSPDFANSELDTFLMVFDFGLDLRF